MPPVDTGYPGKWHLLTLTYDLQALFSFGYRPELHSRVEKAVEQNIKKFKKEKESNGVAKDDNGTPSE